MAVVIRLLLCGVMVFSCCIQLQAGNSNSLMDLSTDGKLLACSNRDSGTVTIVDLKTNKKLREIRVGLKPEGVSFVGDSYSVAVAVYAEDKVLILDANSGKTQASVDVFDEPYSVVSNRSGSKLYVTLEFPGQIVEIDTKANKISRTFSAGEFPRGLAISSDEKSLFFSEYRTAHLGKVDLKTGKETDHWEGPRTYNMARQIAVHPTRPKAYMPHIRSRNTAAHGQGSIFPYLTVFDLEGGTGRRLKPIPMDAFRGNLVVANPWETAISPDGKKSYVVFSGTDDLFVNHVLDDNYREINPLGYVQTGRNPRAVKVSPDSKTFYVYNALDFNVVAYDANSLRPTATIAVTENPLGEEILLGKVLFYSAQQPMVGRRWISCSSCHPDGDSDSRTWHNPEGLRDTPPLFGVAWTHPLHWSADRDETQDFEHTIRGLLMQGRGLATGKISPPLGAPNKGLSKPLDALAAYNNSLKFSLSPFAKKGLSQSAKRGQKIFASKETKCASCHSGPFYTDSNPIRKSLIHNVGTGNDDESEKMGPKYDTPMLLGLYRTAPYLHHGKAATLLDVLTTLNNGDKHGKTSHLSKAELQDLVDFMNSLPFEDPEPAAVAAGLKKVSR